MDIVKIIGVGIIAIVISLILKQYKPEFTIYVALACGIIILLMLMDKFKIIFNLINSISTKANINKGFIAILFKITGIAILTEFATSIANDSGETSIASKIDMSGKVIIIFLSLPIIQALLDTTLKILP